jgi:hypothetical protein
MCTKKVKESPSWDYLVKYYNVSLSSAKDHAKYALFVLNDIYVLICSPRICDGLTISLDAIPITPRRLPINGKAKSKRRTRGFRRTKVVCHEEGSMSSLSVFTTRFPICIPLLTVL